MRAEARREIDVAIAVHVDDVGSARGRVDDGLPRCAVAVSATARTHGRRRARARSEPARATRGPGGGRGPGERPRPRAGRISRKLWHPSEQAQGHTRLRPDRLASYSFSSARWISSVAVLSVPDISAQPMLIVTGDAFPLEDEHMLLHPLAQVVGQRGRTRQRRLGQHDAELLAAVAREHLVAPDAFLHDLAPARAARSRPPGVRTGR